ncbi:uncharacterized protein SPSK_02879 [Sporothrix schenckii 1099-18]|uniref:Uncharacterized protein n=1 Tax=Sporothrix schenckii 1099-18 TaxID=1397361 RepID=A0A0F2MA75_SPOSC|nr:uncharacterized protein SPSK_02879 [Sporothrix schenckii 1099-18]KJR86598.1 hypothetical protein SPSK_02879 [Sporothrix schenckii 1099-18]
MQESAIDAKSDVGRAWKDRRSRIEEASTRWLQCCESTTMEENVVVKAEKCVEAKVKPKQRLEMATEVEVREIGKRGGSE